MQNPLEGMSTVSNGDGQRATESAIASFAATSGDEFIYSLVATDESPATWKKCANELPFARAFGVRCLSVEDGQSEFVMESSPLALNPSSGAVGIRLVPVLANIPCAVRRDWEFTLFPIVHERSRGPPGRQLSRPEMPGQS